jgi:alginate O-acetyltransferase complex protein AlgJ
MLIMPLSLLLTGGWAGNAQIDNRMPVDRPKLPWKDSGFLASIQNLEAGPSHAWLTYTKQWDTYFTQEFVFKRYLLPPYRFMKSEIFDTDPAPKSYIKGSQGWFFSGEWYTHTLSRAIGLDTLSRNQVKTIVQRHVAAKRVMDSLHIRFVILVVPDKHPVYHEFLPMRYAAHPGLREQVVDALMKEGFEVLDATEQLRSVRSREQVFHKTDGHWTDAGAYRAYLMLLNKLEVYYPDLTPLKREDFLISGAHKVFPHFFKATGDSTGENVISWKHINPGFTLKTKSVRNWPGEMQSIITQFEHPVNSISLMLFGDSFSSQLVRMLRENFGQTTHCLQCPVDTDTIIRQKPDIVVFEVVQSNLEYR